MKKILLGLGATAAVITPIATVVACGTEANPFNKGGTQAPVVAAVKPVISLAATITKPGVTRDSNTEITIDNAATVTFAGISSLNTNPAADTTVTLIGNADNKGTTADAFTLTINTKKAIIDIIATTINVQRTESPNWAILKGANDNMAPQKIAGATFTINTGTSLTKGNIANLINKIDPKVFGDLKAYSGTVTCSPKWSADVAGTYVFTVEVTANAINIGNFKITVIVR